MIASGYCNLLQFWNVPLLPHCNKRNFTRHNGNKMGRFRQTTFKSTMISTYQSEYVRFRITGTTVIANSSLTQSLEALYSHIIRTTHWSTSRQVNVEMGFHPMFLLLCDIERRKILKQIFLLPRFHFLRCVTLWTNKTMPQSGSHENLLFSTTQGRRWRTERQAIVDKCLGYVLLVLWKTILSITSPVGTLCGRVTKSTRWHV